MALTEEQARRRLEELVRDYNALTSAEREQMTEASVVRQFIDRLLEEVLDWPIKDPARYKYEQHTAAGRPDIMLIPDKGGILFVEAKRFGAIKELEEARYTTEGVLKSEQLAQTGFMTDRTPEEQQAINYAFENGGTWAILTNFERLRLFNARRDWLVITFERPHAYLDRFDDLWQLAYPNLLNGSLDRLSSQRWVKDIDTRYLDRINDWREHLARDILARRALNPWALAADGGVNLLLLRDVVQRFLDRLVIIRYAEDHYVLPSGALRDYYELRLRNPYAPGMDAYLDHFFRQFDKEHNSALFTRGIVDEALFSDEVLLPIIGELYTARYRSMPADIMGNTYEQYLGKALALDNGSVTTRDNLETRKKQGSYYTPQVLVRYLVDHSLGRFLYGTANGQPDGEPVEGETRKTSRDVRDLRVLDSACGSGSFLIYAYEVLAGFYQAEIARLTAEREATIEALAAEHAMIPMEAQFAIRQVEQEIERIRDTPRLILETHLYGVDLDPQAAEIAAVNLIMRAMQRQGRGKRLPLILNQNIKVGNALIGLRPDDPRLAAHAPALADLIRLRRLLTTDPDQGLPQVARPYDEFRGVTLDQARAIPNPVARQEAVEAIRARLANPTPFQMDEDPAHPTYNLLARQTRALTADLDAAIADHFKDVGRARPFHWGAEFPEVFFNDDGTPKDNGGFTVVIGNPPWEIVMPDEREFYAQFDADIESKLQGARAERRIAELNEDDPRRKIAWETQKQLIEESAAYFKQPISGYQYQFRGHTATHKLFIERVYGLLSDGGRLGYLVPSGIYTDLGTKDLREMLLDDGRIEYVFSFSNERFFFPGVDHRFKFAMLGAQKGPQGDDFWATFRFNPRVAVAPDELADFLANSDNLIFVRRESIEKFSPDSLSLMEFQTRQDYEIADRMYEQGELLGEQAQGDWDFQLAQEFNMTTHRNLFNEKGNGLPLYEGKMIYQFDPFFGEPRYWIERGLGAKKLSGSGAEGWYESYRIAIRDVSNATNERTCIATVLPPLTFSGHTIWIASASSLKGLLYAVSILNSHCFDWLVRFKVDKHVTSFILKQLPMPRLTPGNPYFDAIVPRAARLTCTRPEFAALWEEVMGQAWTSPPGPLSTRGEGWGEVRDEIDALVAHLYGLSRADFAHILGTFPLVFPDSEAGRRKRESLLAVYDAWAGRVKGWARG